jgi:hypothetical protein
VDEVTLYEAALSGAYAYDVEGPTGCGVNALANTWRGNLKKPLITVACVMKITTASDL